MTHKFKETIGDKLNKMNKDMIKVREEKKKELQEKYIPESVKEKLTPEEIDHSSSIGIVIGLVILLLVIIGIIWWVVH